MAFEIQSLTRPFVLLAVAAAFAGSCAGPSPLVPSPLGSQLRIVNVGSRGIEGLVVLFPSEDVTFGNLPGGGTTGHKAFGQGVFRYAAYRFSVDGREYVQPVIDWVGESPMTGEAFTYSVEMVEDARLRPTIRLVAVVRDR